jgi:hypothetical protein
MRTLYKNTSEFGLSLFEAIIINLESLIRLDRYIKVLVLVIAFISFSAVDTYATHFRYGNISWKQIDANTVEFQVAMVFRSNYAPFGGLPVGKTFTPDLTFSHGDGTSRSIQLTVTSVSISDNWSYAEGTFTKSYSNPNGVYLAFFQSCCRISTLVNNSDAQYRVETLINLGTGNTSPVSTMPPIINLPFGVSNASFVIPASDPNGDVLSFSPTLSSQMGSNSSNPSGFSVDANSGIATFNTVGKFIGQLYNASVTINDNNGARIAVDFLIRIVQASNPPVFVAPTPTSGTVFSIDVGEELLFDVKAEDPDLTDVVTLQVVGLPATATMTPSLPTSGGVGLPVESSFSWTPASTGTFIINYTAEDNNGAQATSSVTIEVNELVCDLGLSGTSTDVTCVGGSDGTITLTPTGGAEPLEYSIDNGATYQSINEFTDVSEGTYTAIVRDANDCTEETTVEVGQHNDLPVINSLTGAPTEPINISVATVNFSAEVTDDNLTLAEWNWGDGETSEEIDPGSTIVGSHTYQQAGVYPVTLTITDVCGETATELYEYVVVYDPSGGFVTGGGWFHSPAGAYVDNLEAEGKANFGFVSKYKRGAKVPDGQTQFQFHAEKFNFHSTVYEWLVVAGHKAQYKGEGRVNGENGYGFMLSVVDGDRKSPVEPDKFRIKIWDLSTDLVVYDNQMSAGDDAEASTDIGGGSIVIHDGGKGKSNRLIDVEIEADDFSISRDLMESEITETSAYPNPLSPTGLWIEIPAAEYHQVVRPQIYDLNGRMMTNTIFEVEANRSAKYLWQFDHQNWKNGVYVLMVNTPTGIQKVKLMK